MPKVHQTPSIMLSCISIIVNRNIGSSPQDDGKRMTEYMDILICLFQKARQDSLTSFEDEEVKNQLLSGLPFEVMQIVGSYLDLMAAEITRKFDVIASHREALGLQVLGAY